MPESDVTIGELSRRMGDLNTRMGDGFNAVNRRLDALQFVPRDEYRVQLASYERRLSELEETKKWGARAIIASFIFPVLVGLILAAMVAR